MALKSAHSLDIHAVSSCALVSHHALFYHYLKKSHYKFPFYDTYCHRARMRKMTPTTLDNVV